MAALSLMLVDDRPVNLDELYFPLEESRSR
jgi:hypothetical protein